MQIIELLYKGEYARVVELTIDAPEPTYGMAEVPAIIGAASMVGRIETAEALFTKYAPNFHASQLIFSRFYLGITYCRDYRYDEAKAFFIENWRLRAKV